MILDNLATTMTDYGAISPKIARAIEWLKNNDPAALEPGKRIIVDGRQISVQPQEYTTIDPGEPHFETHRLFIDIQLMVRGRETIYWAPLDRLPRIRVPYDYEKDIVYFEDPDSSVPIRLEPGDFVILFPSDGHKPCCMVDRPEPVTKIVVKIAV